MYLAGWAAGRESEHEYSSFLHDEHHLKMALLSVYPTRTKLALPPEGPPINSPETAPQPSDSKAWVCLLAVAPWSARTFLIVHAEQNFLGWTPLHF